MFRIMKPQTPIAGVALLEALVALGLLAFALMGLLGLQLRGDVDSRSAAQRVVATRLAQDLFERIKANPGGHAVIPFYLIPPGARARSSVSLDSPSDCATQACPPQALAAWDLKQWQGQVSRDLPMGWGAVFLVEGATGQIGVLLGWRANQAPGETDDLAPISVPRHSGGTPLSCPDRQLCQLLYSAP